MYYQPSGANIIHELIGDEVVVVNLTTGTYYSLLGTAATVWVLLVAGNSHGGIMAGLEDRYAVEASSAYADVSALITQLCNERLVVSYNSPPVETNLTITNSANKAPYNIPQLETFADMRELLLLDPISEVDAKGWPVRADSEA